MSKLTCWVTKEIENFFKKVKLKPKKEKKIHLGSADKPQIPPTQGLRRYVNEEILRVQICKIVKY